MTAVCLLPEFLILRWNVPFYFGGTSLLIIVVVTMDFMAQVQAYIMTHQYESLLRKANFKEACRSADAEGRCHRVAGRGAGEPAERDIPVKLENGHHPPSSPEKMRMNYIRILPGDKVTVQMTPMTLPRAALPSVQSRARHL